MIRPDYRIGHIRIEEHLAAGGMGAVFVGFDEKLRRRVALKAVRSDLLEPWVRDRFLTEARLLSQLDHPNICRIYGYLEGEKDDFLVLELIRGRTLRQVLRDPARREGLDRRAKLRIAEQVTRALAAAHEKGIVHRDLKLDNVMLTPEGEVKVLDFGVARLEVPGHDGHDGRDGEAGENPSPPPERGEPGPEEAGGSDRQGGQEGQGPGPEGPQGQTAAWASPASPTAWVPSLVFHTRKGLIFGTPASMSPEQARGETATAASDVYSLGLLLQELFTGRPSFQPGLSRSLLLVKASAGDTLPLEGIGDLDLAALLRRLTALAPAARPTAAEAAERLAWIRGKPGRRRRRLLAAAVAVAFVLGGVKYTLDLRRERQAAVASRNEAEQVSSFLVDLFRVSGPEEGRGPTITAREVLDQGAGRLDRELAGQPRVRARLLHTIGTVYQQLGLYDRAAPLLKEALESREKLLGKDSVEVAESLESLGRLAERQGRYAEARPLLERSLAVREAALGAGHPQVAQSLDALAGLAFSQGEYPRARTLWERALAVREKALGPRHPRVADLLDRLASARLRSGEDAAAEQLFRRALALRQGALGPRHPHVAESLANLANFYRQHGEPAKAEPLYRQALTVNEAILPPGHPRIARNLYNLALCRIDLGDFAGAEVLLHRALDLQKKTLGPNHPDVASSLNSLATLHQRRGDLAGAEALYRETLAIQERELGPDHPSVGYTLANLGLLLGARGDLAGAEPLYRRAIAIWEQRFGPDHPLVTVAFNSLAGLRAERGDSSEAGALFERALAATRKRLAADPDNPGERQRLALVLVESGKLQRKLGHASAAEESWREAVDLMAPLTAHSEQPEFLDTHARALLYLGRVEEARPLVEKLQDLGWQEAEIRDLCRQHGLAFS